MKIEKNMYVKVINMLLEILFLMIAVFGGLSLCGIEVGGTICSVNFIFPLIGIFLNLLIVRLIICIYRQCEITFDKFEIGIMIAVTLAALLVCSYIVLCREHAYYWDETESYMRYFRFEDCFQGGIAYGINAVIATIRADFKGALPVLICSVPFVFTNKTENIWCLSMFFNVIPALVAVYAMFLKNLMKLFEGINRRVFFSLNFIVVFSMPLVYVFTSGYTEVFGVIFGLMVCNILVNTDFEKKEYKKWLLLGVTLILMVMSADFYVIWAVSFFLCYFVMMVVKRIVDRDFAGLKKWLMNVACFGICFLIAALFIVFPFIKSLILSQGGATDNSFWRVGGYLYEIKMQIGYLGTWLALLLVIGFIIGLIIKKSRLLVIFNFCHGLSTLMIFHVMVTLVAPEHSLVLLPFYMFGIALTVYSVLSIVKREWILVLTKKVLIICSAFNMLLSILGGQYLTSIFSKLSLQMSRDQVMQIKEVADWLADNCEEGDSAYFIPHGFPYNPDKFRYINMPDRTVMNIMPYGSAVLGYHAFPTGLFDAKYVLTSEPFCEYSIAEKYESAFMEYQSIASKFELVETFDMGDGYKILVYERVTAVDIDEINFYREEFAEENQQYPELYDGVFDWYVGEHPALGIE